MSTLTAPLVQRQQEPQQRRRQPRTPQQPTEDEEVKLDEVAHSRGPHEEEEEQEIDSGEQLNDESVNLEQREDEHEPAAQRCRSVSSTSGNDDTTSKADEDTEPEPDTESGDEETQRADEPPPPVRSQDEEEHSGRAPPARAYTGPQLRASSTRQSSYGAGCASAPTRPLPGELWTLSPGASQTNNGQKQVTQANKQNSSSSSTSSSSSGAGSTGTTTGQSGKPVDSQQMHVCRLCDKLLSSSSSLDRHMLTHSGERPFVCKRCHMTFTTNGNMHRHMRTHLHKDSLARQQQEQQLKSLVGAAAASGASIHTTSPSPSAAISGNSFPLSVAQMGGNEASPVAICSSSSSTTPFVGGPGNLKRPLDPTACISVAQSSVTALLNQQLVGALKQEQQQQQQQPVLRARGGGQEQISSTCAGEPGANQRPLEPLAQHISSLSSLSSPIQASPLVALSGHQQVSPSVGQMTAESQAAAAAKYLRSQQQRAGSQLDPRSIMMNALQANSGGGDQFTGLESVKTVMLAALLAAVSQQQQHHLLDINGNRPPSANELELKGPAGLEHQPSSTHELGLKGPGGLEHQPSSANELEMKEQSDHLESQMPSANELEMKEPSSLEHQPPSADELEMKGPSGLEHQRQLRGKRRKQVNPRSTRAHQSGLYGSDDGAEQQLSVQQQIQQQQQQQEQQQQQQQQQPHTLSSPMTTDDGEIIEDISQSYVKTANPNAARKGGKRNRHCYKCKLCTYSSVDRCTLVRHLRIHSGERPYICGICRYAFTTKANCERHVRKRHKKQYNSLGGAGGGGVKGSNGGGRSLIITDHSNHQTIPVKVNPVAAQTISQTLQRIQEKQQQQGSQTATDSGQQQMLGPSPQRLSLSPKQLSQQVAQLRNFTSSQTHPYFIRRNPFEPFNPLDLAAQALDLSCKFHTTE